MSYLNLLPEDIFCDIFDFLTINEILDLCIAYPVNTRQVFQKMKLNNTQCGNSHSKIYKSINNDKPLCSKCLHKCDHCKCLYLNATIQEIYQYQNQTKNKPKHTYKPGKKKIPANWFCSGACADCVKPVELNHKQIICAKCVDSGTSE